MTAPCSFPTRAIAGKTTASFTRANRADRAPKKFFLTPLF
jgi:hypothetical protein